MILIHYAMKMDHIEDESQGRPKMQYMNRVRSSLSITQKSNKQQAMAVYLMFTPNQQNKYSKPSKNPQEQNKMKHRKQLKTHLGSLSCNGSASGYLSSSLRRQFPDKKSSFACSFFLLLPFSKKNPLMHAPFFSFSHIYILPLKTSISLKR